MTAVRVAASGRAGGATPASYDVSVAGGVASAVNGLTGAVDYTGSDVAVVVNLILSAWGAGSQGGTIDIVPPAPSSGPLVMSQRVLIPCDMGNLLLRGNGAILKPTGGNRSVIDVSRRVATTVGSVTHTDTSIPLVSMPSWASSGGGYITIFGDLWQYTGISGNTLTGAAIQNGLTSDRSGSQTIFKAFETWQNITLRDFVIDASGITDNTIQTCLIGTVQGALNRCQHLNINNFWVDCIRSYGLAQVTTAETPSFAHVGLNINQKLFAEALPCTLDNIKVNDFDFSGGNCGVLAIASCSAGIGDATHTPNMQYGSVRVLRGKWDAGVAPVNHQSSSGIQVGQSATGTSDIAIEDVRLVNSTDVGIEIDQPRRCRIARVTTVDAYNAGLFLNNFVVAPVDQEITIDQHANERTTSPATGSQVGIWFKRQTSRPFHRLVVRNSSAYTTGAQSGPFVGKGINVDGSFDNLTIDGYKYFVTGATIPSTGQLLATAFDGTTGTIDMPSPIIVDATATLSSGTTCVVAGMLTFNACNLRFKGYAPDVKAAITGAGNSKTNVLNLGGTGSYQGVLDSGTLRTTGPDTTPIAFLMGSSTTIGTKLVLRNWDLSLAPVGTVATSVPSSQQGNLDTGVVILPPTGVGLGAYMTTPAATATTGVAMANANDGRWVRIVIAEDGFLRDVSALIQTTSAGTYRIGVLDTGQAHTFGHTEHTLLAMSTPAAIPGLGGFATFDPDLAVHKNETLILFISFSDTTAKAFSSSGATGSGVWPNANFAPSEFPGTGTPGKVQGTLLAASIPATVGTTTFTGNFATDQIRTLFEYRIASS